jgi:hypothetical protein
MLPTLQESSQVGDSYVQRAIPIVFTCPFQPRGVEHRITAFDEAAAGSRLRVWWQVRRGADRLRYKNGLLSVLSAGGQLRIAIMSKPTNLRALTSPVYVLSVAVQASYRHG